MNAEVDGILVAAHELKAPLTVLRQLALSLDNLDEPNSATRDQMLQVSDRAIRQVNELAKIRRLEDGLFPMEPVAVRPVCDAVTAELRHLFRDQNLSLATRYQNRSPLVSANRELLFSVIYNFAINALHYADPQTTTKLTVKDHHQHVRILVRDFGPALPLDLWRDLRSGALDRPTPIAMRPGSSGLGLYIASRFSRHMHANLGAIRHRDGTTFFVDLPISKQASLFA